MASSISITFVFAIALSFAADTIAIPRAAVRRAALALGVHVASVLFIACVILALTHRPHFAAFLALALVALASAVSNAKFASLREPFVFTDLSLFSQLFSHPRLYLPFLSTATVVAMVLGSVVLAGGFFLDPAVSSQTAWRAAATALICLATSCLFAARLPLTLDPLEDQRRHGFFAVFVAYLLNGMRPATFRSMAGLISAGPFSREDESLGHPDVIVIQSESFFDPRPLSAAIDPSILHHFDRVCRESVEHGKLTVPAWGANTMRSEFALLTGLPSSQLGYARFILTHSCGAPVLHWRAGFAGQVIVRRRFILITRIFSVATEFFRCSSSIAFSTFVRSAMHRVPVRIFQTRPCSTGLSRCSTRIARNRRFCSR